MIRFLLDKIGRRKLFFLGSAGMGACMLISGLTIRAGTHDTGIGAVVVLYMFQVRTLSFFFSSRLNLMVY